MISSPVSLENRILGCWLGKSIGGTLGLPAEGRMDRLHFTFYDPIPTIAPPNDDLELQLVWLHLVEALESNELTAQDFARAWLEHIHFMWDEYGRCRWNLRRGVPLAAVGTFENPFASSMGSPIRSEIWACLFPGDPASAAYYSALDASLDHGVEGVVGETLFAVLQSLVAGGASITHAIELARGRIPAHCETARALQLVVETHLAGVSAWDARDRLLARHGSENFTHAPLNVGLTIWALLYGDGDFEKSILLAVNAGYDTDCTAATVGATLGLALGADAIPDRWRQPIGESVHVGPGIVGIHVPATLDELTARTVALAGKLTPKTWSGVDLAPALPPIDLAALPGTILIHPLDGSAPVPFANGELPAAVKNAGGAEWNWTPAHPGESHRLIVHARAGARLLIDGELVVSCPVGLPFVPATHRPFKSPRVPFVPTKSTHRVRLELPTQLTNQDVTVLLAYSDLHLCPWTPNELPHRARLPASG